MSFGFSIGFAEANHSFGHPAENYFDPSLVQHTSDGCDFNAEASVLNDFGFNATEEQLQSEAEEQGWYRKGEGTPMDFMGQHLENRNIPYSLTEGNGVENLVSELSQNHKVIVAVDSGELWNPGIEENFEDLYCGKIPDHALRVEGIDMANDTVIVTDSGTGAFRTEYSIPEFMDAWEDSNCLMVSTDISPEEFYG